MSMPYAYIQTAKDGQAWLFIGDEPLVPIHGAAAWTRAKKEPE